MVQYELIKGGIMRVLIFKTEYLNLIKQGRKIQTIRLWPSMPKHTPGELVTASNYREIVRLRLIEVYMKRLNNLTTDEAIQDGFSSKEELFSVLRRVYKVQSLNQTGVVIRFERI